MFLVPGNLERQCNAAYVWRESWTAFSCASTLPSLLPQCSSGLDAYRGGDATSAPVSAFGCSHNLSLAATPTDLVESITVIVNDPSAVPCAAPAATNSLCFRWGNETLIKRIQDLLAVSFTPASNAALPSNAVASVFWRWQNAALGTWHDWTANNTVVLDRASTTLVVEAWTHAGLAGTSVWTVVVLLPPTPRDLPTTTARRCLPSAPPSWHPQCTWPSVNLQIHSVHAATSSSCALPCNPFDPTTPECATACVIPKPKSTTPYTPCVGFPVQQDQRVHVTIRRTQPRATSVSCDASYAWPDFDAHAPTQLFSQLATVATTPGIYSVTLQAWDTYSNVPSPDCATCVAIADRVRPRSAAGTCPFRLSSTPNATALSFTGWSEHAQDVAALVASIGTFVRSRTNYPFVDDTVVHSLSSYASCVDVARVTPTDWFGCPVASGYDDDDPTQCLSAGNWNCVQAALLTNPLRPSSSPPTNGCRRSCDVAFQWREAWVDFTCDTAPRVQCSSGADSDRGGDATDATPDQFQCAGSLSLEATASDLVETAQVTVRANNPAIVAVVGRAVLVRDNGASWQPIRSIFAVDATMLSHNPTGHALSPDMVFWRWTQSDDDATSSSNDAPLWHDWLANDTLQLLAGRTTTIRFQAWTQCGQVTTDPTRAFTWTVSVQPALNVTSLNGWFSSLWAYVDQPHCNAPLSRFGHVQLVPAPLDDVALRRDAPLTMQCHWTYEADGMEYTPSTGALAMTWQILAPPVVVPMDFAIAMLPSAATTNVSLDCTLTYELTTPDGAFVDTTTTTTLALSHQFWFRYCNGGPYGYGFEADSTCSLQTCAHDGASRPRHACAGHLVYPGSPPGYTGALPSTTVYVDATAVPLTCCSTPGSCDGGLNTDMACVPLSPSLSRCDPTVLIGQAPKYGDAVNNDSTSVNTASKSNVTAIAAGTSGAVAGVLLLACIAFAVYRRRHQRDEKDPQASHP
ncbi:Aste57867_5974 [Aphanomyces stellatus]|uniref:Aste57867_5974 protein n=1 Tax=Aphanomyces stellatus TaxID=120398 RepID=A0A485KHD7_9STRA|nr:hypothetical protein As57867_005960 [Aphanomyces stellatus]VFT82991.1 Aste57867_5974 [Aphanomyces stellatus]